MTDASTPEVAIGPKLVALLSLAYRARRPALIEGPTGIGKSELIRALASGLGIGCTTLDLSLLEPPDLVGLPVIVEGQTTYALPSILPTNGAGILVLEELNRAERYMQQPALQLLSARRLHQYVLPPDWVCFALTNPPTGEYHVTPLDRALQARFLTVRARADRGAWLDWASEHRVHPAIVRVVREHSRALDEVSPRSWTYAGEILAAMTTKERADRSLVHDALCGFLPAAWSELVRAASEDTVDSVGLDPRAILRSFDEGSPAERRVRELTAGGRVDALEELVSRMRDVLKSPEIAVMAERGEFSTAAFERFMGKIAGDLRDSLQDALAHNATAAVLVEFTPGELLTASNGSAFESKLTRWSQSPLQRYRVQLIVQALVAHLRQHGRVAELRQSNTLRANVGRILAILGEKHAMSLVSACIDLGITPIRPR
ncbi:MAG: AAA family ATPase [Deltaproteobacteria bacterium]|nr:AAA family ATPase [Deltaproteobacteria bacterium]